MTHIEGIEGTVLKHGEEGYEDARRQAVWQAMKPGRYPDLIVRITNEQDVARVVLHAQQHGLKVKARSGGHSFTGSSLRSGVHIDFSAYKEITVDPATRTATVTPGVQASELSSALLEHGLYFPGGHYRGVGLGGYLLQGGFGWNGRSLGPACASVRAIDVVTADGEMIHSDDTTNPDYIWAARGAGSGYFGVVTRYYLDVYPLPDSMLSSLYVYPVSAYDDLVPWFLETAARAPAWVEPWLISAVPPGAPSGAEPVLIVFALTFADSDEAATAALSAFDTTPDGIDALQRRFAEPTDFAEGYDFFEGAGAGIEARRCFDGMWTEATPDVLAAELKPMYTDLPNTMSSAMFMPWVVHEVNGSFSLQSPLYLSPMAVWEDPEDDDRLIDWATNHMRRLEHLAIGIQLADENLVNRPAPFMAADRLERLEELRAKYDPDGRFHSYLYDRNY